jgi:hypothetical protein
MASASEEAKKLRKLTEAASKAGASGATEAVKALEGELKVRVFRRGLDKNGRKIGKYSTRPFYLSLRGARKKYGSQIPLGGKKGRGKNSKRSTFKNGKERRSRFYGGGYKEFRGDVGRQTGAVDLNLSGDLRSSLTSGKRKGGGVLGFTNQEAKDKASANEKRFNSAIFEVTETESRNVDRTVRAAVNRAVLEILKTQ